MLRRCAREEGEHEDDINYISCTVWETFDDFNAWKTGDAFKEAHGGGTVGGIASMLLATAMNTKGKPKAAMWEGTLPVSVVPESVPEAGGWREVEADGTTTLPTECFVAMNRFSVNEGFAGAFEQRFAARESTLQSFEGFRGFQLLRRDGDDPDGFTHSTWSVWDDKASFDVWRTSEKKSPQSSPQSTTGAAGAAVAAGAAGAAGGPPPSARPNIYARPPVPTFYEGILVLQSSKGV